jgi:MYXO-CTERM domain-containing protein
MLKRLHSPLHSSLLLLTFSGFAFSSALVAAPAQAQDAQTDATSDATTADGSADLATSEAGSDASDASDAGDAGKADALPDAVHDDGGTAKPDAAVTADAKADAPRSTLDEDDGCGCRIGAGKPGSAGLFTVLGALAGVGLTVRRRRRR